MDDQAVAAAAVESSNKRRWSVVWEYVRSILLALVLALVIRTFVVQAYMIPSGSMEDTLNVGDRILVNKFIYGTKIPFTDTRILEIREPERGDIIVFAFPKDPKISYIKRIIGLPGDRIQIIDKKVYVNGQPYENPHAVHWDRHILPPTRGPRDNMGVITVPPDSYFVMGDNRDNSYDSRFWGVVKKESIEGPAFIKYWSWDAQRWRVRWSNLGELID